MVVILKNITLFEFLHSCYIKKYYIFYLITYDINAGWSYAFYLNLYRILQISNIYKEIAKDANNTTGLTTAKSQREEE